MITETVQALRERFIVLTFGKNLELINGLKVHPGTLYKFRKGGNLTVNTLEKIEEWCDAQEKERA